MKSSSFAEGNFKTFARSEADADAAEAASIDFLDGDELKEFPEFRDFLRTVAENSPYLCRAIEAHPKLIIALCQNRWVSVFEAIKSELDALGLQLKGQTKAEVMSALRTTKSKVHLSAALAELSGQASPLEAAAVLSRFAAKALQVACDFLLFELANAGLIELVDKSAEKPSAKSGISIIAMGKLGARELNYSSDIDLIIVFDPTSDVIRLSGNKSYPEVMSRFARGLVQIMDERTGEGYVFRTDLRLRPDPGATPLAISRDFALSYYEARGQNWERAALIKADCIAGDIDAGSDFLAELLPFIWRRYLDYAAISDIKSIKRQINAHRGENGIAIEGHNVKLGRGGIREIEFFVQTQQLIAGGRDHDLRKRGTIEMLEVFAKKGWIAPQVSVDLQHAYEFLRHVEHGIQMYADEQSHTVPTDSKRVAQLASLLGFPETDNFREELLHQLRSVEKHFGELFEKEADLGLDGENLSFTGGEVDPSTVDALEALGFQRPRDIWNIVRTWHTGRYRALQWEKARERLTELTPFLLEEFGKTQQADAALIRFDALLARLPVGMQLFSLLQSKPELLRLLPTILSAAPSLADTIVENPLVFDGLLDPSFVAGAPDTNELQARLDAFLEDIDGEEEQLDRIRIFAREQRFLVGVRLLTSVITPVEAGNAYTNIAALVVSKALAIAAHNVKEKHGLVPGGRVCLLALGRLGSCEMTTTSDLDLILIYDVEDDEVMSNGPRQIAVSQYYIRLTQRLIAALSAPMAQGILYELDFRLRPSGNKGPLATSLRQFTKYQREEAWTWEHMALCRARPICGDASLMAEVAETVVNVIAVERDASKTKNDVSEMRARLMREKPGADTFDVKRVNGGSTDVDFIAQYLRLTQLHNGNLRAAKAPDIFRSALTAGVADARHMNELIAAWKQYTAIIQLTRLCTTEAITADKTPTAIVDRMLKEFPVDSFEDLEQHLKATQARVVEIRDEILGKLED
ncbi:MAG: bifunctional [glutamine synthetase] adenylyltransferase/[glutamine synthetase]-adenylyl-L-tyrosine phosphorylase [Pseudomonadota bacterium]